MGDGLFAEINAALGVGDNQLHRNCTSVSALILICQTASRAILFFGGGHTILDLADKLPQGLSFAARNPSCDRELARCASVSYVLMRYTSSEKAIHLACFTSTKVKRVRPSTTA